MNSPPLSRRDFLALTGAASLAACLGNASRAAEKSTSPRWTIGCFNRPFTKWSYDETLDATKAAGYSVTGLLSPVTAKGDIFTSANATPEYLAGLKQKIAARGLKVNMTALRVQSGLPLADGIADTRKQLENARTVGVEYALTFGEDRPERYANYFKIMADAAAFAEERGIKLVMKPHGGSSGASEEILTAMKSVGHRNFKIWYDAGNIIHYTGKDPVAELAPIAEHVTGFCAKDCATLKGDVMLQFGTGKVDFAGVFKKLKAAGFNGPIMVECCKIGATLQETTENAKANRLYLEQVLASI